MIIAVDGPAASGKGTIARALARHYGLPHLDTGLLYRAVGHTVLENGGDPLDETDALAACSFDETLLEDPALRAEAAGKAASQVSAHPLVRSALTRRQREFARQPGGAVLDGRDIGTVIAPEAQVKLFVKATPYVRAKRRHEEIKKAGKTISFDKILADIRERDRRDMTRSTAPLRQADDALLLDTTYLDVQSAVKRAVELVDGRRARARLA